MEKYFSKKIIVLLIFILFVFLMTFKLFDGGIISYTDGSYHFPGGDHNFFSTWSDNFFGVTHAGVMFGAPFFGYLPLILEKIGLSSFFSSYLITFFPVLILSLIVYSVTRKISGSVLYGYFAGLFIVLNNFMLEQLILWPGVFFFNIISLVILFYLTFEIYNHGLDRKKIIYVILNSFLLLHAFFFVLYIAYFGVFAIFYCIIKKKITNVYKFLISALGVICIHSYWIFPFFLNLFSQSPQDTYNGNMFNLFSGYIDTVSYVSLFNFYNYPGFVASSLHNGILQYVFYFGLLVMLVVSLLLVNKYKSFFKKNYTFFIFNFIIFILFFNFALGPNSKISGREWMWAFDNIFGFGFFRSFTRFFAISIIAMIFSFGLSLKMIKISKNKINIMILVAIAFLITANFVFFSGNLNGAIGTTKVPKEYYYLNNEYFKNNKENFSIISLPNLPYEAYRWSMNPNPKIFSQMIYFDINFFSKPIAYGDLPTGLQNKQDIFRNIFNLDNKFDPLAFNRSISQLNVKYIIIKKDLIDIQKLDRVVDYKEYYQFFRGDPQYVLKEDNAHFALFQNNKYSPVFLGDGFEVKKIFPTEYMVSISHLGKTKNFNFMENYNPEWKLYINKYSQNKSDMPTINLSYLYKKSIFDDSHKLINGYANQWSVDPEYIKQNFSKEYYRGNSDGSIDLKLTLYFKPQSYFYLGLIISGATLLCCFSYLGYGFVTRRKKKYEVIK